MSENNRPYIRYELKDSLKERIPGFGHEIYSRNNTLYLSRRGTPVKIGEVRKDQRIYSEDNEVVGRILEERVVELDNF